MLSPREEVLVALDLETTGLDPASDRIIDVGAAKFKGDTPIDTFASLVNPNMALPQFITSLTGITQDDVDKAPNWNRVMPALANFIGDHRLVGHNISFDTDFLQANDIDVTLNPYDTIEMAKVALPAGPEFGLERLSERFGIKHDDPHRALSDALASRDLFLILLREFEKMSHQMIERISRLAPAERWPMTELMDNMHKAKALDSEVATLSYIGPYGFDEEKLMTRMQPNIRQKDTYETYEHTTHSEAEEFVKDIGVAFGQDGAVSQHLASFEPRDGQVKMAQMVAQAIATGQTLVVEAGTGIGKSIAYLLPAALHVARNNGKTIVSTNTINLQEQLLSKDFQTIQSILQETHNIELEATQLKGRSNYLCYRRWLDAMDQPGHTSLEARVLAQCLTWLPHTDSGDRAELALGWDVPTFNRYSAEGCPSTTSGPRSYPCQGPPCFLLKARSDAHSADILIINHSLLITDMANEGGVLPEYDALIIDEAHHLETVATHQLGFILRESVLMNGLNDLQASDGILPRLVNAAISCSSDEHALSPVPREQEKVVNALRTARRAGNSFFEAMRDVTYTATYRNQTREMRILGATRISKEWHNVDKAWTDFEPCLSRISSGLKALLDLAQSDNENDIAVINANAAYELVASAHAWLTQVVETPDRNFVYWSLVNQRMNQEVEIRGAPLDVSDALREGIFSKQRSFVLTGATLSTDSEFERFAEKIGLEDWNGVQIESPFDFKNSVLILVPEDIPEPSGPGYAEAVTSAIHDIAVATADRTLALFTANSALNRTREELFSRLRNTDIKVFGQGRDGPPARVLRLLNDEPQAVALGSMSLWEGIDLQDASIKSLVMTRLPFPVPTDPIHASRSEMDIYDKPFDDYMIPEAAIRFRQGFGRLIRSHRDRGVFVILDRRIISKRYGREFQRSIPNCTVRRTTLRNLAEKITKWHNGETV